MTKAPAQQDTKTADKFKVDTPNPDVDITQSEMKEYGYLWPGMLPIKDLEIAKHIFTDMDKEVFLLHQNNTESVCENVYEILTHAENGGIFGVDRYGWQMEYAETLREQGVLRYSDLTNLPGEQIDGDMVGSYQVKQAIVFDDERGFAIGFSPDAVNPYATWQFTIDPQNNDAIDYYWGKYYGSKDDPTPKGKNDAEACYLNRVVGHIDSVPNIHEVLFFEPQAKHTALEEETTAPAPSFVPPKNKPVLKALNRVVEGITGKRGIGVDYLGKGDYPKLLQAKPTALEGNWPYTPTPKYVLQIPAPADTNEGAISYLKERGIDVDIIADCIDKGLIYQSVIDKNTGEDFIVFASRDESGNIKRMSEDTLNWDSDPKDRMTARDHKGSDLSYPFVMEADKKSTTVFVFDDPMEALSHATLYKINGHDPKSVHRIAIPHDSFRENFSAFKGNPYVGFREFVEDYLPQKYNLQPYEIITVNICPSSDTLDFTQSRMFARMSAENSKTNTEANVMTLKTPSNGNSWNDMLQNCTELGLKSKNNQMYSQANSQPHNPVHDSPVDMDWQEM